MKFSSFFEFKKNSCRGNYMRNYGKLFTVKGGKFKFSAQLRGLATFVDNGTKVKMPSGIKPPLKKKSDILLVGIS